jgi:hypothetical protein
LKEQISNKLAKQQKEAIAEQLATFFFDFWTNRQNEMDKKINNRNSKAVALGSGLLRNFPETPKATT